jgi:hypothetical protein
MKGFPVMTQKQDLSTLFISGTNGVQFSYFEIFEKAKDLIVSESYFAGPALHKVYFMLTGQSHLKHSGINSGGFPSYESKPDYKVLADKILTKLEKIKQDTERKKQYDQYYAEKVSPELARGVDEKVLDDIGY